MKNDSYQLIGEVKIPDDKREQFNSHVLELLRKCGIRRTEEMILDGKTVTVIDIPVPDAEGNVLFNYSVFEQRIRQMASYNIHTCQLHVSNMGVQEFGLAMLLIRVLQEAFSETLCCLTCEKKLIPLEGYCAAIRYLLGVELSFPNRARMWDLLLLFRRTEGFESNDTGTMIRTFPVQSTVFMEEQMIAAFNAESKDGPLKPSVPFSGARDDIRSATLISLCFYCCELMRQLLVNADGKEKLLSFLKELVLSDLPERKRAAERRDSFGILAEISLYVLPVSLLHAYACATGQDFWAVWETMSKDVYTDIISRHEENMEKSSEKESVRLPFYKAIRRDNEDEFMEFWEDDRPVFSEKLEEELFVWKERMGQIRPQKGFEMESYLSTVISELYEIWNCRYVDKSFVTEFLLHRDSIVYQKALLLFRSILDADAVYFPEFTPHQAHAWLLERYRDRTDRTIMSAYQSLLVNHRHRKELLGF